MSFRRLLRIACAIASTACLAAGLVPSGPWLTVPGVLFAVLAWLAGGQSPSPNASAAALIISTGLAAMGVLIGADPVPMILAAAFALAGWDLAHLQQALADDSGASVLAAARFERSHYRTLAIALGAGLVISLAGRAMHLQIPLAGMVVLVVLALFGLERTWRVLARRDGGGHTD